MSFDVFLTCFRDKELVEFARADFDRIVAKEASVRDGSFVRATFPDGEGDFYLGKGETINGLMGNHMGGHAVWDAFVALAAATGSAIYWASSPPNLAVPDLAVLSHLPDDMVRDFGPAVVVSNGRDLLDAIMR